MLEWDGGNRYSLQQSRRSSRSESWSERLQLSGSPAIRIDWTTLQMGSSKSQDKTMKINGAKFFVAETDGQSGARQLYDGDRQLVMGLQCDSQGHLKELRLPPGFDGIRYNYDV